MRSPVAFTSKMRFVFRCTRTPASPRRLETTWALCLIRRDKGPSLSTDEFGIIVDGCPPTGRERGGRGGAITPANTGERVGSASLKSCLYRVNPADRARGADAGTTVALLIHGFRDGP
jgi:hypothetical protein